MKKNTVMGLAVAAAAWAAPSIAVDHFAGPMVGRGFFAGGVSIILLALVFSGFKKEEDGS